MVRVGESDQTTGGESRTVHDSGGERALGKGESPGGRAPRNGGSSTLKEHCPGKAAGTGWKRRRLGRRRVWRFEVG